jgi:hypothetical protein
MLEYGAVNLPLLLMAKYSQTCGPQLPSIPVWEGICSYQLPDKAVRRTQNRTSMLIHNLSILDTFKFLPTQQQVFPFFKGL